MRTIATLLLCVILAGCGAGYHRTGVVYYPDTRYGVHCKRHQRMETREHHEREEHREHHRERR